MAIKLTERVVSSLEAGSKRCDVWDSELEGLGVRVSPDGRMVYVVRYRTSESTRRRFVLGRADRLKLSDARTKARDVLGRVARGEDPQAERMAARQAARLAPVTGTTFRQLAGRLVAKADLGERTRREWGYLLEGRIFPTLGDRDPAAISRADVRRLVEDVAERTPARANDVLKVLRWVYARATEADLVSGNPCTGVRKPAKEQERSRTLTNAELRGLWSASEAAGLYGAAVRLALLSGVRREEAFSARWSEFDREAGVWKIAASRTKSSQPHDVPLLAEIVGLLDAIEGRTGGAEISPWLFPGMWPKKPLRPTSKAWARLLEAAELEATEDRPRFHDLRRTVRDRLTRDLRVAPNVAESILGHVPPKLIRTYNPSGVALRDKRAALQRWAHELARIVSTKEATRVVSFREGA